MRLGRVRHAANVVHGLVGAVRRSRLAWLSPSCHALHRRLRILDLGTGRDSPLSLPAAHDASTTRRLSTPRRRRSVPNATSKTRSRRSENASPSRSQNPSRDVHAVSRRHDHLQPDCVYDAVKLSPLDTATAPAGAVAALVRVVSGDVAFAEDGSTPTADLTAFTGAQIFSGNMRAAKFIQNGGAASIGVEFYAFNPVNWPLPIMPKLRPEL